MLIRTLRDILREFSETLPRGQLGEIYGCKHYFQININLLRVRNIYCVALEFVVLFLDFPNAPPGTEQTIDKHMLN